MIRTAGKAMMYDQSAEATEPQRELAPWIEPMVTRLVAGSAELENRTIFDNADES